jgi:hypothetical protein
MKYEKMVQDLFIKPEDTTGKLVHAAVGLSSEAKKALDIWQASRQRKRA